ncbi:hypothetical protein, partial [Escherichia coli]|uniref:hypothetical protein n=1 Tax=Escherichia coli TaxID=562 RepID=UPI0019602966
EKAIRKAALQFNVPFVTTMTGAEALVEAIIAKSKQKFHNEPANSKFLNEFYLLKPRTRLKNRFS